MIILFILIVISTMIIILLPFYGAQNKDVLVNQTEHPVQELEHQKENLLQSIRELDFDFETQKISPSDYKQLRAQIEKQTVEVLKKLETAKLQWEEMEKSL